ncbi:MAG: excinuclease ABC subunit UvrB [Candidatus Omnitrophica bacterium]|nr:excinuclease ABC subunit UvrB [Candidatus Omnitrophota bacterium]
MDKFKLVSDFRPKGDQPEAIKQLLDGFSKKKQYQTLLGVTGSGKTYTIANVIAKLNKPALIISHNKTLAAQLYTEFKDFFPHNAVEYFVSYYDYYQPEAYIPKKDLYIEKDASINDDLDKLRLSATSSLMTRKDVIVVSSVSCIYNLGSPEDYSKMFFFAKVSDLVSRDKALKKLIDIQYERNDMDLSRGKFRVRGDVIEIFPAYADTAYRLEMDFDQINKITEIDPLTGEALSEHEMVVVYPAKHFVTTEDVMEKAIVRIKDELENTLDVFRKDGKLLEAERLRSRTLYDIEMMNEVGYCSGIENYSRLISDRPIGSRPFCLLDYFPDDFITIIDESHVTIPQIRGMFNGDRARKQTLVDHGFRLPSALDNRPLMFNEFEKLVKEIVFVSATPSDYERNLSHTPVEQIIRPTGLIDPEVILRPTKFQVKDLIKEVKIRTKNKERTFVTTLTKRLAEDLASYMQEEGIKVKWLHSEIDTIERVEILKALRKKEFDCLVGVNLLREGLDIPEVSLVAVLDADKEGFLRSTTSLIQVAGRAARNVNGTVIMYADTVTSSMKKAIDEMNRRRTIQLKYNEDNDIKPETIKKAIKDGIEKIRKAKSIVAEIAGFKEYAKDDEITDIIVDIEEQMYEAARNLDFEKAIKLREELRRLKRAVIRAK